MPGSHQSDQNSHATKAPTAPTTQGFTLDEILQAIDDDQFYLAGQAQINLETLEIVGFECLARWEHPERGEVAPFHFIPVLEDAQQCQ